MKTRKKFISVIVSAFCAAAISVGAIIGIASNRSSVNALAATAKNFSSEEYARLLHVNDLKEVAKRPDAYNELYTTDYDTIVYNRQKGNNWGYLSMACCVTSKILGFATGGLSELGTKALGAGACFFLRESMLEKVGDSTAQMLNKTIDVLNDTMNREFSKLKEDIATQTDILNDSITDATNTIINKITGAGYDDEIKAFKTTAFENSVKKYGYDGWKADLQDRFGSVANAEATAPADPKDREKYIKKVYDTLYIVAEMTDGTLYDYIMGVLNKEDDSILEIFYNSYLLGAGTENFDLDAALYNCIQLAQDLYNTYLFGNTCLQLAYLYQSDYQAKHGTSGADYIIGSTNITQASVERYLNNLEKKIDNVEKEILRFYARVLALSESYTYADSNGKVYGNVIYNTLYNNAVPSSVAVSNDTSKFTVCHNGVRKGDTLYMQDVPVSLSSTMNSSLYFKSSDESLATVTKNGTVSVVGESGSFDISLMADDEVIYSRTFNIGAEAFSGGFGTQAVPYFISKPNNNANDLKFLAEHSEYWVEGCHFLLIEDIDLSGISIGKIGTEANPFKGVFDGNNHVISNKSGDALFETIGGTVKNLTLSGFTITGFNKDTSKLKGDFYGGIICLFNRGTIENCHIVGSSLTGSHRAALASGTQYYNEDRLFYGAVASNYGKITNSSAIGVRVSSSLVSHYDGGNNCYPNILCYSGALVGFNNANSLITDCLAKGNDVYSHIHNRSYIGSNWNANKEKIETTAYFILGGLVGESHEQATVSKCIAYGNNPHRFWEHSEDDYNLVNNASCYEEVNLRQTAGKCYGAMTSCYSSKPTTECGNKDMAIANMSNTDRTNFSANGWDFTKPSEPVLSGVPAQLREVKAIKAVTPVKTTYHMGDKLNLAGFAVLSDSGQVLTNATVKQPDMSTWGEKVVEVVWNGLKTSFKINVLCTHNYVEKKVISVGDCVTNGEKLYSCSVCQDEQKLTTPATGHSYKQVVTEATCLTDGYTTNTCERCGDSFVDNRITALGHSYADKTVAPTCTEKGYTAHDCTRCDESYTDNEVAALGHDMTRHEAKAPTCDEIGWEAYDACTRGDYTTYKELAPLGHIWGEWSVTQSPTCTVAGEKVRTCSRASHIDRQPIDPLGHEWGEWVEVKAATCTEKGQAQRTCGRDSTHEETKDIPAIGHKWGEWNATKAATCTEAGQEQRTCLNDTAHKENRAVSALGHNWGEWTVTKAATCTEAGEEQRICGRDTAHKENREVSALGHDTVAHEGKAPTYTEKGWSAYETCTRCDYTTYQELEALGLARKFKDEVGSIESDPYNGIKAALATYATLTYRDREQVVEEYAELEKAIADYNQKAEKLNESYDNALSVALKATITAVAAVSALAAAAFVLGKRV